MITVHEIAEKWIRYFWNSGRVQDLYPSAPKDSKSLLAYTIQLAIEEVTEPLLKEIAELKKDKERLASLRSLMGHVQDGSSTTVVLFQDDATNNYFVKSGNTYVSFGETFNEAIDKAIKEGK